jgi:deoxyadenosine/deoxycytidine kinase
LSIPPPSLIRYVAIEGVIGVGKTSLVHRLHSHRGGARFLEAFEENPFLTGGFYSDIERYAFDTEMFFLLSRFRQQREIAAALDEPEGAVLADYLFAKNRVFAEITLSGRDYAIWRRLYESLEPEARTPDLVVYLKAGTPVLLDQIRTRNRPFERDLSLDYLTRLNDAYDAFFDEYDAGRLLTIDVSRLDFVRSDADYAAVVAMIEHKVATIEEGQGELDFAREAAG